MLNDLKDIYIKKRTPVQWITMFIVILPLLLQALLQFFNFPSAIKYTIDIAWIAAMLWIVFSKRIKINRKVLPFVVFVAVFFCYCLIIYVFRYQSIFYFLWGFRNNFRFFLAFLAIVFFLERDDIDCIFKVIDAFFVINVFVSIYQFFVLDLVKDYCGGIFGSETGSNASTLLFFSIVVARSILKFMNGSEKAAICFTKCAIALLLAILAELKFFVVVFVLILLIANLVTRFSIKKVAMVLVLILLIGMAGPLYQMLFGSELSIKTLLAHFTYEHYSSAEDVGRFTAIPQISETIHKDWLSKLFGLGLGNCDTSSFAICNTPFFQSHQEMNYIWFSSACWFLETGFVGLLFYLAFFAICLVNAFRQMKRNEGNLIYSQIAIITSILCVLLTFYNASLRSEIGYLAFFILALPFINENNVAKDVYARHGG